MTNKKLAYWLLTSLTVLSLVACQKQETSSVVSESSSQSVAKSTNTSSSAKKSEKKSSSEASSKTTEDNSSEMAAESVTAESVEESVEDSAASGQFQPVQSVQSETYVDTYSADYGLSYSEGEVWNEEYTSPDYDVVEETPDYATVYHEPTEEEAVAIVQQMMADIPSRAEAVVQYGNTGLGGWYSPTVAAEMERQGYWEQFNQTVADLQNAQNQ